MIQGIFANLVQQNNLVKQNSFVSKYLMNKFSPTILIITENDFIYWDPSLSLSQRVLQFRISCTIKSVFRFTTPGTPCHHSHLIQHSILHHACLCVMHIEFLSAEQFCLCLGPLPLLWQQWLNGSNTRQLLEHQIWDLFPTSSLQFIC